MLRSKTLTPTFICCALLWPLSARAQIAPPQQAAEIAFGPVALYPSLQILEAGKDSNVYNQAQNPKEDYTLTVETRALAVTRIGLNELMVMAGSDYLWFKQSASERSSDGIYALRFNLSASRLKPFVGAQRNRTRSRPNPEIEARAGRIERQNVAGSNFNLTERTAITASAVFENATYDDGQVFRGADLATELSQNSRTYTGGVRYLVTPLTTLVMAGRYVQDIFPRSHGRDSRIYSVAPTVEFSPDAAIRGTLTAGVEVFKPQDPQLKQYKGATLQASLNWTLFGTTTFTVRANRNVSYSYKDNEPYYLITGGRLNVAQRLFGPVELQAGVDREFLSYRWRRGVIGSEDFQRDTTDLISGGVGITLRRGFKMSLLAERTKRHSSAETLQNFERTRLLSSVTIGS